MLGFYWDDWPTLWIDHFYGLEGIQAAFNIDRPALAWLFNLTIPIGGESPAAWQTLALVSRWAACLAFWWTLRQVWPNRTTEVTWAAFLFAIYPGFRQQPIAVTYSADWIIITLFMLSLGLMVQAARMLYHSEHSNRTAAWAILGASWLMAGYAMFSDEYYVGLELLRPILLWAALAGSTTDLRLRIKRVLLLWLPYLALLGAFLYWRLFVHVSPRGQVQVFDQIARSPISLVKTVVLDILESGLSAWALPLNLAEIQLSKATNLAVYFTFAAAVAAATIYFLFRLEDASQGSKNSRQRWGWQAVILGFYALFIAGWPFWATSLTIGLYFPWDRFNLAMNFGASLLLAGLLVVIFRRKKIIVTALAIVIGLASANTFHLGNLYRQDWDYMKTFFWQLSWRAPAIEPGTLILTHRPPFQFSTDNSLTAPLNWIYNPDQQGADLPYLVYDVATREDDNWKLLDPNKPVGWDYRVAQFQGSTNRAISVFFRPPNCVKLLDPVYDAELAGRPWFITEGAPFSKPELVHPMTEAGSAGPELPPVFGPSPIQAGNSNDWCYLFEKAELARQSGDWDTVARLGDQAAVLESQITEANSIEWMPYIEAYARTGRLNTAEELTMQAFSAHPKQRRMLCGIWDRVKLASNSFDPAAAADTQAALGRLWPRLACDARDIEP